MKCINCGIDNNLKERTANQGRCKQCGHQFVFDPKRNSSFSDLFFKNAIASISAENNHFFTPKQFAYFLENRISQKLSSQDVSLLFGFIFSFVLSGFCVGILLYKVITIIKKIDPVGYTENFLIVWFYIILLFWLVGCMNTISSEEKPIKTRIAYAKFLKTLGLLAIIFAIICFFRLGLIFCIIGTGVGFFLICLGIWTVQNQYNLSAPFPLRARDLNLWIDRWSLVNGRLEKLLPILTEENATPPVSSEISSYSFDRVVVCDRDEIAQFLIANNFHFDYNCAILSITGYPQGIFDSLLEMLKRNPNLTVYTFHDASPEGVSLTDQVQNSPQWFGDLSVAVYDAGLCPNHVFHSKNLFIRNSEASKQQARAISTKIRQTLSAKERTWLEQGNFMELESFTPQKLLKVLAQTVNSNQTQWQNERDELDYSDSFTEVIFYSSDTFG